MTQQAKAIKSFRIARIGLGVLVAAVLLLAAGWVLTLTLGNRPQYYYAGKSIADWQTQLNSTNLEVSKKALAAVDTLVIPQLTEQMFHDTNDSHLRILLIDALNQLPGVNIFFSDADGRRVNAAVNLGELGPGATSAIPALVQAVKGTDAIVRAPAIGALGAIHGAPNQLIPLLMTCLDDDNLDSDAAKALGNYGKLAEVAVPKIVPLLHAPDKDARAAAAEALQKIDPEAYAKALNGQPTAAH